jgi:hypothetical protein
MAQNQHIATWVDIRAGEAEWSPLILDFEFRGPARMI